MTKSVPAPSGLLEGQDPQQLHPWQAVRLLEAHQVRCGSPRLGGQVSDWGQGRAAERETIRLRPSTSLAFPVADIESLQIQAASRGRPQRYLVTLTLAGLYGVTSPLPRWYAQEILWAVARDGASAPARAFLDIFHHRLLSLLYRAWRRARHEYDYIPGARDQLSRFLLGLAGLTPDSLQSSSGLEPARLLRYLGLLLLRNRPAAGLEQLLTAELRSWLPSQKQLKVQVIQLPPVRWVTLPADQQTRLGRQPTGTALGSGPVLGRSQQDRTTYLELRIGPLSYRSLLTLTPGTAFAKRLLALSRLYLKQSVDLAIRVTVPTHEVPRSRLGTKARLRAAVPSFLGSTGPKAAALDPEEPEDTAPAMHTFSFPIVRA